uniref:Uncharacterized protein n=1 Tax=Anopheles merus TaxID=30066 RepID=A0A182VAN4_ANOME
MDDLVDDGTTTTTTNNNNNRGTVSAVSANFLPANRTALHRWFGLVGTTAKQQLAKKLKDYSEPKQTHSKSDAPVSARVLSILKKTRQAMGKNVSQALDLKLNPSMRVASLQSYQSPV